MTADGLITGQSHHGFSETRDRLVSAITENGMAVLARIDHAGAAATVGLVLRPTEMVMFGNPKAGTLLMQVSPTMGLDLPLKALVWEDANGMAWLTYNDPHWLAARHGLGSQATNTLSAMTDGLAKIARHVLGAQT